MEWHGEAALECGAVVIGVDREVRSGGHSVEEVTGIGLAGADEDGGRADVVEVCAVVGEPEVVVSDCGEATLGGFILVIFESQLEKSARVGREEAGGRLGGWNWKVWSPKVSWS